MLTRTVSVIFVTTFLIIFIINLHSDLLLKITRQKLCHKSHNTTHCKGAGLHYSPMDSVSKVTTDVDRWSKIFKISSLVPSSFTVFVLAAVLGAVRNKEKVGLYVSVILALQSLVYLTISICRSSQVEHLFAGVLLNILIGDLPGAILFCWALAAFVTKATMARSLVFVAIEGMVYLGGSSAHFVTQFVPDHIIPFSYFFAATFTLSVLVFLLLNFVLPTSDEIISFNFSKKDSEMYSQKKISIVDFLCSPLLGISNEYLAGILLGGFLTEFGKNLFDSVVQHYLISAPLQQSYYKSKIYVWGTTAFQGFAGIAVGKFLTKVMYATDATLILISLSCSAFWMVLIGYIGIDIMLLIITICFAGFLPLAMACLRSTATKENNLLDDYFVFMLGIMSSFAIISKAILVYNSHIFINANRRIYRPFTLILAGIVHLVAFIVVASISWTFNKPIIEMPIQKKVKGANHQKRLLTNTVERSPVEPEELTEKDRLLDEY